MIVFSEVVLDFCSIWFWTNRRCDLPQKHSEAVLLKKKSLCVHSFIREELHGIRKWKQTWIFFAPKYSLTKNTLSVMSLMKSLTGHLFPVDGGWVVQETFIVFPQVSRDGSSFRWQKKCFFYCNNGVQNQGGHWPVMGQSLIWGFAVFKAMLYWVPIAKWLHNIS